MKNNANQYIWQSHDIHSDKIFEWHLGDVNIWCRFEHGEIHITYDYNGDHGQSVDTQKLPEDASWTRWVVRNHKGPLSIQLSPVLPDRAIVIKPESSFRMIKNERVKTYARIPVWIRINITGKEPIPLIDIPSVILSNTWFGNFQEGELCYWISSGLHQNIKTDTNRPHMAICPISMTNNAEEELLIEKICLRVDNLTLYNDADQLWSDETRIVFKGSKHISHISVSGRSPEESPVAELITLPRNPIKKSFVAKTFSTLKDLPGLGIAVS